MTRNALAEALFQWAIKQRFPKNGDQVTDGQIFWQGARWLGQSLAVFDPVELSVVKPDPKWTREDLLAQKAVFLFKDIAPRLGIKIHFLHQFRARAIELGEDPWQLYGIRKVLERWYVRMDRFAPEYQRRLSWQPLPQYLSGNEILDLTGIYRLADVARRLPFSLSQLRHRIKVDGPELTGGWKDEAAGVYVVDMPRFAVFIRKTWKRKSGE